ncbi:elongation factor EF-TS [Plasmodium gonderi]|uniref:Elongation factor Ts, mitochondrial n=1 Tax=Plasmodium gonderi TaxID=77519 RepID=A0A1Y1JGI8_PLAGO|nr:elongation factor EF-TS [Plasmodium gonderi]GAW80768.1 elongation factor EF-TS [Plasmodium gonderi]
MKLYTLVIFILVNSFLDVPLLCYKTNKNFQLTTYTINRFEKKKKKKKVNERHVLCASLPNEHLKQLKYVRQVTSASIQICNNALRECNNDTEKAIELIRKNTKNASFVSSNVKVKTEGLISSQILGDKIVLLEVLTDSDFVAKNEKYIRFVSTLLRVALTHEKFSHAEEVEGPVSNPSCVVEESLLDLPYEEESGDTSKTTVREELNYLRNIFREDIRIGRYRKYVRKNENEFLHYYIHNKIGENVGLSGVLLVLNIEELNKNLKNNKEYIYEIANDVALHILSAKPVSVSISDLPEKIVKQEMDIIKESLHTLKKPENIITNMVNGKLRKFYNSVVLLEQEYMLDDTKRKVSQVIQDFSKKHSMNISVKYFDMFIIGEKNILRE